jgi:hypothetical protein
MVIPARLHTTSFLLAAPFSLDSIFKACDPNLDMRFVLILNYKHVRTAGLTVRGREGTLYFSLRGYSPKESAKLRWAERGSGDSYCTTTLSGIFSKTGISLYNINFAERGGGKIYFLGCSVAQLGSSVAQKGKA